MTETEWLNCTDPDPLIYSLKDKASMRKFVLFAVACRRLNWEYLEAAFRDEVEVQERYADGLATAAEVVAAREVYGGVGNGTSPEESGPLNFAKFSAEEAAEDGTYCRAGDTEDTPNREDNPWCVAYDQLLVEQCRLLRDIVGNPFRRVARDPAWLRWNDGMVGKIAQAIYDERAFDRMPILADALEDAGCDSTDILDHCRRPNVHVRGCWVIDLLLGKE
jgi:hypothetical protein